MIYGISADKVARMTKMQALMGLEAMNEELKDRIRLAGGKVDDGDREATLQDILGFGI